MKALVIATYLGPLPNYFPLWLRSAGCNREVDFLIVNDGDPPEQLPANVRFAKASIEELRDRFSEKAGMRVALESPYKLNDFKPLFWLLAPDLERYDYWGYCDLDVIFGDLSQLLNRALGHFDMILSEGHLRFLRNDEPTREAWREIAEPRGWRDVFADPVTWGMDEHRGINRVFSLPGRTRFANPALIADLDPGFRQMRLPLHFANYRRQAFFWRDGRVFREYWHRGRYGIDEFIYAHFQKRKMTLDPATLRAEAIDIGQRGFSVRDSEVTGPGTLALRNPWHWPNFIEARNLLRERRRRILGQPTIFKTIGQLPE